MSLLSRLSRSFAPLGIALAISGAGLVSCSEKAPIDPKTHDYTKEKVSDLRGHEFSDIDGDGVVDMMTYGVVIIHGETAHVEERVRYITDEAREQIGISANSDYIANAKLLTPELQRLATEVRNSQYALAKEIDTERFNKVK